MKLADLAEALVEDGTIVAADAEDALYQAARFALECGYRVATHNMLRSTHERRAWNKAGKELRAEQGIRAALALSGSVGMAAAMADVDGGRTLSSSLVRFRGRQVADERRGRG